MSLKLRTTADERRDLQRFPSSRHAKGVAVRMVDDLEDALAAIELLEERLEDGADRWQVLEEQRDTLRERYQRLLELVEPVVSIVGDLSSTDLQRLADFVREEP